MRLPVGRYLRAVWLSIGIFLLVPAAINAQSTQQLTLRQTNKTPLPQGTKVTLLARQTSKKDPRGTWARLRVLPGESIRLPEDTPASTLTQQTDVLQSRGRTEQRYGQTSRTRTVYFAYAVTPDGDLYESVAYSAQRKRHEAAYERVGRDYTFNMRRVQNSSRISKVKAAYFGTGAPPADTPPPPVAEEPVSARTTSQPDANTGTGDTNMPLNLRQLTLEYVEELPEGPKVHLLPIGTQVVAFKRPAQTNGSGFSSIPLADLNGDLPENQDPAPVAKTSTLTFNGSALDLTFPTTSAEYPSAYLMYALTPNGELFQSVAPAPTGHVPAYTVIDNSFFRMAPIEDEDRAANVIAGIFSRTGTTGGPSPILTGEDGPWWTSAWVWWLAGLLGLALLGGLYIQLRRQQRTVNDPYWNAPLSAQRSPTYATPEPEYADEDVQYADQRAQYAEEDIRYDDAEADEPYAEPQLQYAQPKDHVEEEPWEEPVLELNVVPASESDVQTSTLAMPEVSAPRPVVNANVEEEFIPSASDLEALGDGGPKTVEMSNMLRAFVEMDNALFREEVAPFIARHPELQEQLRHYRRRVRANIERIFLK